jgi:hypothetical protein
MASAAVYDQFEDAGLAFSDEELKAWSVKEWGEERLAYLVAKRSLPLRSSQLRDAPKVAYTGKLVKAMADCITWNCIALGLRNVTVGEMDDLPSPPEKAGQELNVAALSWRGEIGPWLDMWESEAIVELQHLVTIGRRCGSIWKKADKSLSNKAANCLMREINVCTKYRNILESMEG